jgi:hypothetical protein
MDSEIKDIVKRLEQQGKAIEKAIAALRQLEEQPASTPATPTEPVKSNGVVRKGNISAAGRRRLAAAMKARWAVKKKAGTGIGQKRGLRKAA